MNDPQTNPTLANGTIPYRVWRLEQEVKDLRICVERDVNELRRSVGRLTWVMLTASVTLSVSSVVFAISVLFSKGSL